MPELEPIRYLRSTQGEMTNKGGGGGSKEPWVDVDKSGLRSQLVQSVVAGQQILARLPESVRREVGIPMRVELRDKALAKSNRPTSFLADAGVPPMAAGKPGELFLRLREQDATTLQAAIANGASKTALYSISTIVDMSIHEPVRDAFGADLAGVGGLIEVARDADRLLRLDLFPWVHGDTVWSGGSTFLQELERIGLTVRGTHGTHRRESIYVEPSPRMAFDELSSLFGIRQAGIEPRYGHWRDVGPQSMSIVGAVSDELRGQFARDEERPVVGVLDSGIETPSLAPWVVGRETYDVGADLNQEHGTFVGGLVLAGAHLNPDESCFGGDSALLFDGQVLPAAPIGEFDLIDRLAETVRKHPEIRVWNCSFAQRSELNPMSYSVFASEMDALSGELGVLFVQAAGNYESVPARAWPPAVALNDGISSPADAVNSLVVGSLSHRGGRAPVGAPASYSRRGPGFGGQTKPDVTYWSGDFGPAGEMPHSGIRSLVPGDQIAESAGTSFATPLVSAIAASVWSELANVSELNVSPALVKGLLMHGAFAQSKDLVAQHKNYYGAGIPPAGIQTLFEDPGSFTTVHEVNLVSKISWLRAPFPVPRCLFTAEGKLRAEIFMTVAYAPILDSAFGQEAVRTCVDASFGVVDRSGESVTITGKVPEEKVIGAHSWETELVADGKWSPVRTHYAKFPRGVAGSEWGLKLSLTERHDYEDGIEQRAYVIVTMRGLDEGLAVHADGVSEIQRLALWNTPVSVRQSVTIDT